MRSDFGVVWDLRFRRDLTDREAMDFVSLLALLEHVSANYLSIAPSCGSRMGTSELLVLGHDWWRYLARLS